MKKTLIVVISAFVLGLAAYFSYSSYQARQASARLAIENRIKEEQASLAYKEQLKASQDEIIQRGERELAAIKARHDAALEKIERDEKAREQLFKANEALSKSKVALSNAEAELRISRLEREKQLKLSLLRCEDPIRKKEIEAELEKLNDK
jgi:hypothetical protein